MGDRKRKTSRNSLIRQIFDSMDYGYVTEDLNEARYWLASKEKLFAYVHNSSEAPTGHASSLKSIITEEELCTIYAPEAATVEHILKKQSEAKNEWLELPATTKTRLIYDLGAEIQEQYELFVPIEAAVRGILTKDTTKALPLLTEYLQYYSGFSIKYNSENPSWKPKGLAVGIFSDKNSLAFLGLFLGPSLAAGYNVILQTGPKLSAAAALLIDLSIHVGIPEGTIRLIPGPVAAETFFTHPSVSVVAIFDDLRSDRYLVANNFGKTILNFYSPGIPMLVFDDADLDSACQSLVDAAWGYKGMLPWSVRHVYIQENIFDNFIKKIELTAGSIVVAASDKKNADVSWPDPHVLHTVNSAIEKAKSAGATVFQPKPDHPIPALIVGSNIFTNNVIKEDASNIPILTLTAFRNGNEAVALANNSSQGLAASVWTESTSLANEVIRKLKVSNIWMNSHGQFSADIATSPYKSSGNGYFGGKQGFYEYVFVNPLKAHAKSTSQKQSGDMEKAISEARKGHESWYALPRSERVKLVQKVALEIEASGSKEKWVQDWVDAIYDYSLNEPGECFAAHKDFNVSSMREGCGVVAMEALDDMENQNKKLLVAALVEGNSVILLTDSKSMNFYYPTFCKLLPKGVFATVIEAPHEAAKIAALHKEVNLYFGERFSSVFTSLPLDSSVKFQVTLDNWDCVKDKVTLIKNVWWNVGQSFV